MLIITGECAQNYCRAQKEKKDIVVRVGSLHIQGLSQFLKSEIGPHISIVSPKQELNEAQQKCVDTSLNYQK